MRAIVRRLAARYPTAIISGRGREKVESFVALPELFYAGSHGMDIVGPAKEGDRSRKAEVPFQPALPYVPRVNAIHDEMIVRTREVPGSSVEHNKFCVSVSPGGADGGTERTAARTGFVLVSCLSVCLVSDASLEGAYITDICFCCIFFCILLFVTRPS